MEANQPNRSANVNLDHYWRLIMERRWLVLTTFCSVVLLSVLYMLKTPKIYEGSAEIEIDKEADAVMDIKEVMQLGGYEQDYLQTQYRLLAQPHIINQVITNLHLERDPRYASAKDLFRAVRADVIISPVRLTRLVDVRADHTDPQKAADIANEVANVFIAENGKLKIDKTKDAIRELQGSMSGLESNAAAADAALQNFRISNNIISSDEGSTTAATIYANAKQALSTADNAARDASETLKQVEEDLKNGKKIEEIAVIAKDPLVIEIKRNIDATNAALASLQIRYKDQYPSVKSTKEALTSLQSDLKDVTAQIFKNLTSAAQLANSQVVAAEAAVEAANAKNLNLTKIRTEMMRLERAATNSQALWDAVVNRTKDTELLEKIKSNNISLKEPAQKPQRPVKPNVALVTFFGLFGGLMCSVAFALLANYLDNAVKGQEDVEGYLGLTFLGYVPHIEATNPVDRDLEAHLHPTSSASEGFRTIRASISLTNLPEKLRSVAVASTAPAEGKSLVASNFAIVSAQAGLRTLLVEADLRRPSVHKTFQLHSPIGLATYLQNHVQSMDEIIHKTDVKNLEVICCGAIPSNPSELVGSVRMTEFIQDAVKRYDRVVLDCPPISAVSDPLIVAAKADGLIFVSKFNKIRREYANRTVRRVQDAGIHVLGAIINNIDFEGRDSYYYSQYYYQNRYYSTHYKSADEGGGQSGSPKDLIPK